MSGRRLLAIGLQERKDGRHGRQITLAPPRESGMIAAPSIFSVAGAPGRDAVLDRQTPASGDDGVYASPAGPGAAARDPRFDAPPLPPPPATPGECLAAEYERARRQMLRMNSPVLRAGYDGETLLDKADPDELVDAADTILRNQAAREAVRAAARLEQAWRSNNRDGPYWRVDPADELVRTLTRERDQAAAFLYDVRRRQTKLKHLEAVTQRAVNRAAAEAKPHTSDPIPCTPAFAR